MTVTAPVPAADKLFSDDQLEKWKDEVAHWWGKEKLRYDQKRTAELFRNWLGVSKKEAIEMEFNSREDQDKFIEQFLNWLVIEFRAKLHKEKIVASMDVKMSFQHGAFAVTEFPAGSGNKTQHDVPGHAGFVGQVTYQDGSTQPVFQRFISHPFWQYCTRR